MSHATYMETIEQLERSIARYQGWITYLENSDKSAEDKAEGIAVTQAMITPLKAELDALNISYYGTAVLYR